MLTIRSRERRLRPPFLLLLTLVAGCASGARTAPGVTIAQVSQVEPLRTAVLPLQSSTPHGVPVDYELDVTNPFDDAITLTAVEVETVGPSGAYSLKRARHVFSLVIQPRSATKLPIRAWVQPLQDTDNGDVSGPVTVRGTASFVVHGSAMRTAFAARVQ